MTRYNGEYQLKRGTRNGAPMTELLTLLKQALPDRLADGREVDLSLVEATEGGRISAFVRGPAKTQVFFTIQQRANGYVLDAGGRHKLCAAKEDIVREIGELAYPPAYHKSCWNCGRGLVQNRDNLCPKCRVYVLCACGNCLCDNPQFSAAKAVPLEPLLRIDGLFGGR